MAPTLDTDPDHYLVPHDADAESNATIARCFIAELAKGRPSKKSLSAAMTEPEVFDCLPLEFITGIDTSGRGDEWGFKVIAMGQEGNCFYLLAEIQISVENPYSNATFPVGIRLNRDQSTISYHVGVGMD